jgi:hypothetical protein
VREEFGGGAGLSVPLQQLVLRWDQALRGLAPEMAQALAINF